MKPNFPKAVVLTETKEEVVFAFAGTIAQDIFREISTLLTTITCRFVHLYAPAHRLDENGVPGPVLSTVPVEMTLADLLAQAESDASPLPLTVAHDVIAQVWTAVDYLHRLSRLTTVFCLHPAFIGLHRTSASPPTYEVRLLRYVPYLFLNTVTHQEKPFCHPALFKRNIWFDLSTTNCEVFTFARLVELLLGTNTPPPECSAFLQAASKAPWDATYRDPFLSDLRKQAYMRNIAVPGEFLAFERLGRGRTGTTYRAFQQSTATVVTIKEYQLTNAIEEDAFEAAASLSQTCNHPKIVRCRTALQTKYQLDNPSVKRTFLLGYLVYDYYECSLDTFFATNNMSCCGLGEEQLRRVATDLFEALWYLHYELRKVHGNIKPENVVLRLRAGMIDAAVLTDHCHSIAQIRRGNKHMRWGKSFFVAPEILASAEKDYSYRSDFFSLGVMFFYLFTGRFPYNSETPRKVSFKDWKTPLKTITKGCIGRDPANRPSWKTLHHHPLLQPLFAGHKYDYARLKQICC